MTRTILIAGFAALLCLQARAAKTFGQHWVGTWASAISTLKRCNRLKVVSTAQNRASGQVLREKGRWWFISFKANTYFEAILSQPLARRPSFLFHTNCRLSTLPPPGKQVYAQNYKREPPMSDDTRIFTHVMQKSIGNAEYWREIVIFEEGPFVFRVVQENHLSRIEGASKVKPMWPGVLGRSEWICPSKEAATEQALRCLHESKNDHWLFPPSASSAA